MNTQENNIIQDLPDMIGLSRLIKSVASFMIRQLRTRVFILAFTLLPFTGLIDIHGQSLDDYLVEAAENNPEVKAYFNEYMSALEKIPQAGALPDPQLAFGFFIKPMELPMGDQRAEISLMQMFPWFGTTGARSDEASQMALARYEAFRDAKNRLFREVKTAWYDLYELEKEIEIVEENIGLLRKLEEITLTRFGASSSGLQPVSGSSMRMPANTGGMQTGMPDVLRVKMEINETENMLENLKELRQPYRARFNGHLNRPLEEEVALPDTVVVSDKPFKAGINESILNNNPAVRMQDEKVSVYELRRRTAVLEGRPSFGIGLNYMVFSSSSANNASMNGGNMLMPMVTVTIPVFRQKYRAMEREAALMRESAAYRKENMINELSVEVAAARRELSDAERRLKLYSDQSELAEKTLNIMITSYSTGKEDFGEVLRVSRQLLDFRLGLLRSAADHERVIAKLEMLTATGMEKFESAGQGNTLRQE